jgi:hypothetical protein
MLMNPFVYVWNIITWLFARTIIFASQLQDLPIILAQDDLVEEEVNFKKPPKIHKIRYNRPCDMKMTLYIVNETNFNRGFTNKEGSCALPFYAQRVSLIFLFFLSVYLVFIRNA